MLARESAVRVVVLAFALVLCGTSAMAAPQFQSGEIIVKFKEGASQSVIHGILTDLHATPLRKFARIGVEHDRISGGVSVADAIARYRNHPAVEFIEPNYTVSILRTPDDPRFDELWALHNTGQTGGLPGADISATEAWETTTGSPDVLVGVIDTGVDYTHPDLAANIYVNPGEIPGNGIDDDSNGFIDDVHGWDFVNFDNDPMDDHGHGTHVSGTVGAVGNNGLGVTGVSWSVRIMPLKFLDSGGSGTTSNAIAAIEYGIQMGVKVMSNSWGGGAYSEALRLAIQDANTAGIFFVAAAGNASSNNDLFPAYPASYDVPNIIAVAATNALDQLAGFSNFGVASVDLAAPGTDILSTLPSNNYGLLSGTSMATPHVSGALALILARYPSITVPEGKALLLNSVDPLPELSGRVVSGGRLNVARAIEGPDSIPPSPVLDLAALAPSSNGVPLQWTATGDDGTTGTVTAYDIRYASFEITEANFDTATPFVAAMDPHPAGSVEQVVVTGLDFSTTYSFAIKARDEYGNSSTISNVASATTLGPPDIDVSPASLSAALLTGATVTRTLTLRNQALGTLDFSLGVLTSPPGGGGAVNPPPGTPGGSPGATSGLRWSDLTRAATPNPATSPHFPAGAVRTATLPDVITDPSGDGGSVDLTALRGLGSLGELQVEMEFSAPIDRFNFGGYLSLDIDRNRSTGYPPSFGSSLQDIGAEYEYQFFNLASGYVDLYNIVLGTYVGSFPVEFGARTIRFSTPLELLGHDDGTMDVTGVIGNSLGPTDWFPNSGHGTILGIQFLSVFPRAGTVSPGGSVDIQVTFDASGLFGGGYDAQIRVASNDPDEAEVLVPAHLDVTGAPDIALSKLALNYGNVFLGVASPETLVVTNRGTDQLTISGVAASPGDFAVDPSGFSLTPGASHAVVVAFSPQSVGAIDGSLTIASNDPDEGSVTVALHGNGLIAPDIGVDPTTFAASLRTGETATSPLTIRNTGGSDLTFGVRSAGPSASAAAGGSPVLPPSSVRGPTPNQTQPRSGPPSVRAEYEGDFLRFGITDLGELMPFQSPVGNEHLAIGTFLSGYTVAYISGGLDHVRYAVNSYRSGIVPVSYREIENTPSRVSVEVVARTDDGVLGIRRVFQFSRAKKHVEVTTELQNLSSGTVTRVVLKEDTDWDVDGDFDDDGWDYDRSRNMVYAWDQHYAAVGAEQAPDLMDLYGWNDYFVRETTVDVPSGPVMPFDGLEVLHFELGTLAPMQRRPVTLAYAVGSDLADLRRAMDGAVGARWLSVSPASGVVPAGGSAELTVRFDPGTLSTGDYSGRIVVESNDPDEPEVALPASLHVTGIPDVAVSPDTLNFGSPFLGQAVTRTLFVTNLGTGRLEVTSVTPGLADYVVHPTAFTLEPLQNMPVTVTFTPSTASPRNSSLELASDDPDEGVLRVTLLGEGLVAPDIGVTPTALSADLLVGERSSQRVTIQNTGGSNLTFTVAQQVGASATAAAPPAAGAMAARRANATGRYAGLAPANLDAATNLAPTAVPIGRPAVIPSASRNSITAGNDVLVLSTTAIDSSLGRALGQLGHGYDVIYTNDFTGIDFTPYLTLVVAMNGGLIEEASCQALADAAAPGRLLFMIGGTNYGPYYSGVHNYLLSHTGEAGWTISSPPHLSVVDPSDPLASGLPASVTFASSAAAYYMLRINDPAAHVAALNGDNHPALVHKSLGAGTLVYYINPPDEIFWNTPADFAILKQIVENAMALGGAGWLSVAPRSGTVPPGGSVDVDVTFDATGLFGGVYDASIRVASNDPDEAEVSVPAHMTVTGVPDISPSSLALNYGDVFLGVARPETLVVTNAGTDQLTVSGVAASPSDFTVSPSAFSLAPGASHDVVVTFSPQGVGAIDGSLTLGSNDPDEGSVTVALHGTGLIPPRIAVTPSFLRADLLTGESSTQALTIQNNGGSDLVFDVTFANIVVPSAAVPARTDPGMTTSEVLSGYQAYRANASGPSASIARPSAPSRIDPVVQRVQAALSDSFIIYREDVEGGAIGWTHYSTHANGVDQWGISSVRSSSGARSWRVSQHAGNGADALQSPSIDLTGYADAVLTFKQWYNFDDCNDPSFEPDGGIVEISRDGGVTWTQITPLGGYPYLLDDICGNPLAFRPAYSHDGGAGSAFVPAVFDLTPYIGGPVRIRFQAGWDCGNCELNEGWYVDDITVYSRAPRFVTATPASGRVAAGSSLSLDVAFNAEGIPAGTYSLDLVVASNDPVTPASRTPVTMHVIGAPFISVQPTSLSFGQVLLGSSGVQTLVVANTGTELLAVSSMTLDEGSYAASPTAFSVAPGASQDVTVTFAPTSVGTKDATLSIAHNASGSPTAIPLSGSGILPPILTSSPDSLLVKLNPGAVSAETITLGNVGGSDLHFSIETRSAGAAVAVNTDPPLAKGAEGTQGGAPVVLRSGGPDQFGHRWIDSDATGGPAFNWQDLVPIGKEIPLTGDDATSTPVPIGFPFHYFGNEFTTVRVCTNGYLSFTSNLASFSNLPLPGAGSPENLLAVFWDDLYFDLFSKAFYYNDGGKFIVEFYNVRGVGGGGPYTFEVILYPSGAITYQYLSMSGSLTSATIGFQNGSQNDGLTVAVNQVYVHGSLAIQIEAGLSWLSLGQQDGTIPTGGSVGIRTFLNTVGLSQGDHQGVIAVYTNDPAARTKTIPVTLHVNGDEPPVVSAPGVVTGAEGAPLALSVTASDPEGDPMYSLTAAPLPAGATFVANAAKSAGDLRWTPDYDQAGSYTVMISASSARHASPVSGPIDLLEGFATVQIAIANTDRAPVVTAPASQTVAEGVPLTFVVTAADPDDDPVAALDVGEIPVGATFTRDPGQPRGTFAWTPTFANAGSYNVTFTASNALVGTAVTAIVVTNQNRAPVADAGGPYVGVPGVPIAFNGTKSADPDGESLQFAWDFGDGNSGTGPSPLHPYASAAGSPFTVRLTASDGALSNTATTTATVQGTLAANVFFALNLNYIFPQILPALIRIEPIGRSFAITDVLLSTVRMSYNGSSIPANCKSIVDHDSNHNGVQEVRVCFTRNDLKSLFSGLPNGTSHVEVTVEGNLLSGGQFRGTTMVQVVKLSFLGSGALAQVAPNPLNPQATLTFVTTEPGMASAQLFDLNGRLVRSLLPRQYFMPGDHRVTVDGRNDQGNRLASGVYYYRVETTNGVSKGAITVLK